VAECNLGAAIYGGQEDFFRLKLNPDALGLPNQGVNRQQLQNNGTGVEQIQHMKHK
jgi:hypothetical protein